MMNTPAAANTTPRAGHRVAHVQGLKSSSAAGLHRPAKSGRATVRRAAIDDGLDEAADLGVVVRGVRF
jgi:hypothetical protein